MTIKTTEENSSWNAREKKRSVKSNAGITNHSKYTHHSPVRQDMATPNKNKSTALLFCPLLGALGDSDPGCISMGSRISPTNGK